MVKLLHYHSGKDLFQTHIRQFSQNFNRKTENRNRKECGTIFSTVLSASLQGLHVEFVQVEADISNGLPMLHMVGYLASEVKEAGERVKTAIRNSDMILPAKKIIVNLSPAHLRKKGALFDLPIAITILESLGYIYGKQWEEVLVVGELSLDGKVKPVSGILPIVMAAKKRGCKCCMIPKENVSEGELVENMEIIGVSSLQEACRFLNGEETYQRVHKGKVIIPQLEMTLDYSEIRGQKLAKRAVEIAVAGHHNLLLIGSPGAGKSMLAKRIPTILPPLTLEESLELTTIYSIIGNLNANIPLITERPFREVHQSVTRAALIGGGANPSPGEISLAHKGVLFLDEIAEFPKNILELLRQPLESHEIQILRKKGAYKFPADFLLVAAMNPCPCGYYPNRNKCMCSPSQIQSYLGHISQPMLDRMDLCVEVEPVHYEDLQNQRKEESSSDIRKRVVQAQKVQKARYKDMGITTNSQLSVKDTEAFCKLGSEERCMMKQAFERLQLTARKYYKVLRVARTIADLDGKEEVNLRHLREALSYRMVDQKFWGSGIV